MLLISRTGMRPTQAYAARNRSTETAPADSQVIITALSVFGQQRPLKIVLSRRNIVIGKDAVLAATTRMQRRGKAPTTDMNSTVKPAVRRGEILLSMMRRPSAMESARARTSFIPLTDQIEPMGFFSCVGFAGLSGTHVQLGC